MCVFLFRVLTALTFFLPSTTLTEVTQPQLYGLIIREFDHVWFLAPLDDFLVDVVPCFLLVICIEVVIMFIATCSSCLKGPATKASTLLTLVLRTTI